VEDFMKYGKLQRAYLGVYFREIDEQLARDKGLNDLRGVFIDDVIAGGSAEKAGIHKGDVIIRIQNKPVNGKSELQEVVSQLSPGDHITVTISRDGKDMDIPVAMNSQNVTNDNKITILGATFEPVGEKDKARLGLKNGFKVIRVEPGKLKDAGIKEGFILVNIDKQPVSTTKDIEEALSSSDGGVLIDGFYPNGMRAFYGITL
jgi:S1-C subfamily serine protease